MKSNRTFSRRLGIALVGASLVVAVGLVGTANCTYTREARVTSVNNSCVLFTDTTGNVWAIDKTPTQNYGVGQEYVLTMDTMGTDSIITDDTIIKVVAR